MEFFQEIIHIYEKLIQKENLKNLLFFLMLNLSFMFVEVLYGLFSNSLGLLTDGAHMLLDCSAIIIGLYSSYLSDKKSDTIYNFGYGRSEVLGTFINSVFLVFVALYIVFESIERFISPKEIHSDHLILVSFIGLLVNLLGVYYLHGTHGHSHVEERSSHGHSEKKELHHSQEYDKNKKNRSPIDDVESGKNNQSDNSHSHEGSHGHSHGGNNTEEYNENLYAIYIHILADALGSVSVLISSFLIRFYGLNFTDPICSLFISAMILYSVWPVLKNSSCTLLHLLPEKIKKKKARIENSVKFY
jgi:zinc transporter 5/7